MSDRGENREQPSIPEQPGGLSIEHASLAVSVVALTIAVSTLLVEHTTRMELLPKGAYSILAALIVCGFCGFLSKLILRDLAVLKAQRIEVRQMLRHREAMRQRGAGAVSGREPVGVGRPHRSSRGGDRSEYWTVYSDVLEDLGGLDGEPSGN